MNDIYQKFINDINNELQQALNTAKKIIESAYEEALDSTLNSMSQIYHELISEIKSYEVTLEREIRINIQKLENHFVEDVMVELYGRFLKLPINIKRAIYQGLLSKFTCDSQHQSFLLLVNPKEISIFKDLLINTNLANCLSIQEDVNIDSGFMIISHDKTIFYDYTLKTIFDSLKPHIMSKAKSILFGEKL